jgi:hypothetical protein
VVAALERALDEVPDSVRSDLPAIAADGGWERYGIPGHALEQAEYRATVAHLRRRLAGYVLPLAA